jgi:hypothetical protein
VAAVQPPPSVPSPPLEAKRGGFMNTGIELTLGGYLEGAMTYRSRNLTADIGTPWNTIPFPTSPNFHLSEFRFTARQTRLSLLAQGRVDAEQLRTKGELLLLQVSINAAVESEDLSRKDLDWARRQGTLSWGLRAATSLARLQRD